MIRTVDLFAGAGGFTAGFHTAGFRPVMAVEADRHAAASFAANFGCDVHAGAIEHVDRYPAAEVVIGGPPCQGFSALGHGMADSRRTELNGLWRSYLDAVRQIHPKAFVVENVPPFRSSREYAALLHTLNTDRDFVRYQIAHSVLDAADYGAPQHRRRNILVAVDRHTPLPWPPPPTHGPDSPDRRPHATVRDTIGDLPGEPTGDDPTIQPDGTQNLHAARPPTARTVTLMRAVPPDGDWSDIARTHPELLNVNRQTYFNGVLGRLKWDQPSMTITTGFQAPFRGRFIHPTDDRCITPREAARLQTFPDSHRFCGPAGAIARQIGNAVPPTLAGAIARHVWQLAFAAEPLETPQLSLPLQWVG